MSFGFSGEIAFVKGEQRRTAGGKALEKARTSTAVPQQQQQQQRASTSMFNGRDDAEFSSNTMPTGKAIKRPPPPKQLFFDPSVSQQQQQQQRNGGGNSAVKRSANSATMAAPKKPAPQRNLTFGQQKPAVQPRGVAQAPAASATPPKSALRTTVAIAASRRAALALAAAAAVEVHVPEELANASSVINFDEHTPTPTPTPTPTIAFTAPVSSPAETDNGRKLIDTVAQNVLQEMRSRVQSCTTDLRNLLSQIASVRSNMPSVSKITDLHTAAQQILATHAGFETRIDACDADVRKCTAQVDEAKLRSYWVYATVTVNGLPLFDSSTIEEGDHGAAHSTLQCGTRVLVEFPSQQCGNPADVSDAKYVRTRLVDSQSGESTLFWLPVQGNGRFWEREALAAVDPKAVDTTPSRYLADFSTQP